jgi:hypothetical protein
MTLSHYASALLDRFVLCAPLTLHVHNGVFAVRHRLYSAPKFAELTAVKGGKGFVIDNEASRPKTRLAALSTSAGALGAGLFGLGKLAGAGAAKGGATKAVAASATSADVAEAVAVLVAGGAVGQTGTSVITKNSRIRKIYATPEGELPLLAQAAVGLSVPASLLFAIFAFLQSL